MSQPAVDNAAVSSEIKNTIITTPPTYILDDLSFLDKLSKKGRTEVLKNLRQIRGANEPQAERTIAESPDKCYFLETIPIEVRNMIYELLLVNPILGKPDSVPKKNKFGAKTEYHLETAIIRASRQICTEASKVLYSKNAFFVSTVDSGTRPAMLSGVPILVSPITRYTYSTSGIQDIENKSRWRQKVIVRAFTGIAKARKWIFVVGASPDAREACNSLNLFCHTVSKSRPSTIELLIQQYGMWNLSKTKLVLQQLAEGEVAKLLQPLTSLRNLQSFLVRAADECEVPDYMRMPTGYKLKTYPDAALELGGSLTRLETGSSTVENLEFMNRCLVNYSRAFERSEVFAEQMGKLIFEDFPMSDCDKAPRCLSDQDILESHPVESALNTAWNEALCTRDMPEKLKFRLKWVQEQFKAHYDSLPAAIAMRELQLCWKAKEWAPWRRKFKCAVDELDAQYLRIREARKELFKWDVLNERGTELDLNDPAVLLDEKVNWERDEPLLGPKGRYED